MNVAASSLLHTTVVCGTPPKAARIELNGIGMDCVATK